MSEPRRSATEATRRARVRWDRVSALALWMVALAVGLVAVVLPTPPLALVAAQLTVSTCALGLLITSWERP